MNLLSNHWLKMEMERAWRETSCLCPNHLVRWNQEGLGWRFSNWLFYMRGTRRVWK
jgi:hypothetical protein